MSDGNLLSLSCYIFGRFYFLFFKGYRNQTTSKIPGSIRVHMFFVVGSLPDHAKGVNYVEIVKRNMGVGSPSKICPAKRELAGYAVATPTVR